MFDSLFPKEWTTLQRLMWLKTNALARAVYATVTGNPVSFTAKAAPLRKLEVAFSPVQDLHGYDSPWPAGGWKNKLPTVATTSQNGITLTSTGGYLVASGVATATSSFNFGTITLPAGDYVLTGLPIKGQLNISFRYALIINGTNALKYNEENPFTLTEESTVQVLFQVFKDYDINGKVFKPMICLASAGTDFAPYSNECPISGWDSLTVEQRGKNLFDPSTIITGKFIRAALPTESSAVGTEVANEGYSCTDFCFVAPSTKYTTIIPKWAEASAAGLVYYSADKTAISGVTLYTQRGTVYTFTTPANAAYVRFCWPNADGNDAQLALGEVSTYVPYNPSSRSISISLGSTVYSGWVDVVTGQGEVTGVGYIIPPNRTNLYNNLCYSDCVRVDYGVTKNFTIKECNWLKIGTYSKLTGSVPTICIENGGYVYIGWDEMKTVMGQTQEAIRQYLTDNPLVITFDLPTPIPIQLTPQEVESLAGDNTMWTDAASLEVTYRSN